MPNKITGVLAGDFRREGEDLLLLTGRLSDLSLRSENILTEEAGAILKVLSLLVEAWEAMIMSSSKSNPGYELDDINPQYRVLLAQIKHNISVIKAARRGHDNVGN